MAYTTNPKPLELTQLPSLADDDTIIVGDTSDTIESVKAIPKSDFITDLSSSFATTAQGGKADTAVQPADLSTYQQKPSEGAFANGDKTKLDGIAVGATANSSDATLLARANHTGTQAASTISDFASVALASAPAETGVTIGVINAAATSKTTPVDADSYPIVDSQASNVIKRLTFTNLKAFLKTYFDGLYQAAGSYLTSGGALGTPSSGTLTNCGSLPVSGITASTSTALGVGSLEVGHASDTTITRVSAGKIAVEGVNVVTTSSTDTLTNKTLTTPEIASIKGTLTADTDGSTITFDKNTSDFHAVTLGGNRTLALSNMAAGDRIVLRLAQDGTGSRTVTWFSTIKWVGGTAPTLTTTASKADVFGFLCTSAGNYDGFVIGQNI
jgi:hypothetical protein